MPTVLITGCSSGFGRALVPRYLELGWNVIATFRSGASKEPGHPFESEQRRFPNSLHTVPLDITSDVDRARAATLISDKFEGKLACLINNAGQGTFGAFEDFSPEQIRSQMEVGFFGALFLTRSLAPALRKAQGRVLVVSSLCGYTGMPLSSLYCASKHALEGLFESL